MSKVTQFLLDGVAYNVHVTQLSRSFSILEGDNSGRTQDGGLFRDVVGTYYNYSMTVEPRDGDNAAMDAFWEAISQPEVSHVCVFPYGQSTLTQRMYVTGGEQNLRRLTPKANHWGELSIAFTALSPKVTP